MGSRSQVVAAGILMAWLGAPLPVAAQSLAGEVCPVVLREVELSDDVLVEAQGMVARIFGAIGVTVRWDRPSECGKTVVVKIVSGSQTRLLDRPGKALGLAIVPGNVAYIVLERIEDYAGKRRLRRGDALGLVIAHEIGHLLIGWVGHDVAGLMSAAWSPSDIQRAIAGQAFSPADARTIRMTLAGGR